MDTDQKCLTEMILNLTLEIIYLLTGEDYGPIKKSPTQDRTFISHDSVSEWSRSQRSLMDPPPSSLKPERNKRILETTKRIIELLTGEVPIRCQDVSVYLSMEEWEYLEGHKDLYKDLIMEEEETYNIGGSDQPDGCQVDCIISQNGGLHKGSIHRENFQDFGKTLAPPLHCLERVHGHRRNLWQDLNLPLVMGDSISLSQEHADLQAKEKPNHVPHTAKEHVDLDHIEERLADPDLYPKPESPQGNKKTSKGRRCKAQDVVDHDMCLSLVKNPFPVDMDPFHQMSLMVHTINASAGPAITEYEDLDNGVQGLEEPGFALPPLKEEIVFHLHETNYPGEKPFGCSECGERFSRNSQLVEHHRLHSAEKPFACPECGKQFADRADVVAHQLVHARLCTRARERPSGELCVVCPECGLTFADRPVFEEHQKVHRQEKAFVCGVCGKSFSRRGHLSNHKKIHTGGKRVPYSEGVKKCFPYASYTRKRSFSCPECGKCFPSRCHLDRHQRIHTGEKPFCCSECDRRFTDRSGLVIHQRVHTGEKPYACDECGKRFRDRSGLVVHQRTHTGEQPYKCLQCGKCFHSRTRLEHHKRVHVEEKTFACPQCDQVFLDVAAFALHHRTHLAHVMGPKSYPSQMFSEPGQEHPQLFLCPECGRSFDDPSVLSSHIRTHRINQTKDFSDPQQNIVTSDLYPPSEGEPSSQNIPGADHLCSQCSQSFPDRASLMAHEVLHLEEKPYKCTKCGDCFVLKGYLLKHLETHG